MDVRSFGVCLYALKNQAYEMKEVKTQQSKAGPLDKADRERLGIRDYKLIVDEQSEYAREVFEVYSDRYDIYTLDYFYVVNNRKEYDIGFQARSEERRVGKESRSQWWRDHERGKRRNG